MKIKVLLSLFLCSLGLVAQELPPISNYAPTAYLGGIQNWSITQNENHKIFFANNEGLLVFNGSKWKLFPSNNESILRSVHSYQGKIYSGAYMDFGYWTKNSHGSWKYQSISTSFKNKLLDDEQFWGIISYQKWVLFQSLQRIYIYNTEKKSIKIIEPSSAIFKMYQVGERIFYQSNEGIFEIENATSKLFLTKEQIQNNKIVSILLQNEQLVFVTQNKGMFVLQNNQIVPKKTFADNLLQTGSVYCATKLHNNQIALGTISQGLVIVKDNGDLAHHITQNNGISNNTILSLFEDKDKNLWLGLDNGIDCINMNSKIQKYANHTGILGTVYTSIVYQNKLYIGTNQGLFSSSLYGPDDFSLVNGTKGQVWSLFIHDGILFCGHDLGTFIINENQSSHIYDNSGTWKFEIKEDEIIQGNYYGLSVLKKIDEKWQFHRKLNGFNYSCRFFEITPNNDILVSHEYRGLYRLILTSDWTKVKEIKVFTQPKKGKNASLETFNNHIYYASQEGVFKYNNNNKTFEKSESISSIFNNQEYVTGKMVSDKSKYLWFFTKNYLHYFSKSKLSEELNKNSIPISSSLTNSMPGYENIFEIRENEFLIGTTDGYYILKNEDAKNQSYRVYLNSVSANTLENEVFSMSLEEKGSLKHHQNNIHFSFHVPEYDSYINSEYQYILEGFQEKWSNWSPQTEVSFENLQPGTYTFKVKAKVSNAETENTISYSFEILKPWYFSHLAILIYILLSIALVAYVNHLYRSYYHQKHQKIIAENNLLLELKELENQKEIMKIKNEQLVLDVDKKNKELAVSTMNLIKKDELLKIIKEDLKKTSENNASRNIKSVISTINKTVSEDDTWNVFKEAFDKADNGFIKKIKIAHPSLTPNDLRLCAYLRLNLSSKEIAPLLNISVRSVEIKRYRLRKKMDLSHDQGLVEYILSV